MQPNISYFNNQLHEIEQHIKNLENVSPDQLTNISGHLKSDLEAVSWMLDILDPSAVPHIQLVEQALKILAKLGPVLLSKINDLDLQHTHDIQELKNIYEKDFPSIYDKTICKVQEWTSKSLLSTKKLAVNHSDLNLASKHSKWQKVKDGLWYMAPNSQNYVFSLGKYYNPIPYSVSSYIDQHILNAPQRIEDIISLMRGEEVQGKAPAHFMLSGKIIEDSNGLTVQAPGAFTRDFDRTAKISLNGVTYADKAAGILLPNEFARTLYGHLGKECGDSIMFLCNQSLIAYPLATYMPALMEKHGTANLLPKEHLILPSGVGGNLFDISIDQDKNIKVTAKILLKVHSTDSDFPAFLIYKTEISIPHATLNSLKSGQQVDFAKLQSHEFISTLIVNNEKEAREVLAKF